MGADARSGPASAGDSGLGAARTNQVPAQLAGLEGTALDRSPLLTSANEGPVLMSSGLPSVARRTWHTGISDARTTVTFTLLRRASCHVCSGSRVRTVSEFL